MSVAQGVRHFAVKYSTGSKALLVNALANLSVYDAELASAADGVNASITRPANDTATVGSQTLYAHGKYSLPVTSTIYETKFETTNYDTGIEQFPFTSHRDTVGNISIDVLNPWVHL